MKAGSVEAEADRTNPPQLIVQAGRASKYSIVFS